MNCGEKIKMARRDKGITQKELGRRLNVSQSAIAQFEKSEMLKIPTIIKIANALECDFLQLIR